MEKNIDFLDRNLADNDWIGLVLNNQDPTFSGRAQVRVFGVMNGIIDEHIPWAYPVNSNVFGGDGGGSISIPKIGQFVRIRFNNGDVYSPEIIAIQNIDTNLIDRIKEDYDGTHVILHDPIEDLSIIYQKNSGLMVFYRDSFFQISPDSMITLQHADSESLIQMEGDITRIVTKNEVEVSAATKATITADEVVINGNQTTKIGHPPYSHGILAEPIWALLSTLATALDAKLPATPGVNAGLIEAVKQSATSTNVLIGK
jgi:hypothetical protein